MEQKNCFILMPFTKTDKLNKGDLDYIYEHILKKAVEEYQLNNQRVFHHVERFNNKVGSIISGIVNNLKSAELVIADLTGLNPNVMYELGVRHSLKRGTIIISQDIRNLPSDLRDYLTVEYSYSQLTTEQPANYERFKTELHKTIAEILTTNKYDSPVLSYLEQKQRFRDEEEVAYLKTNTVIVSAIADLQDEIWQMIKNYDTHGPLSGDENLSTQLFNLKLNNLSTALNELYIHYDSSIVFQKIMTTKTMLAEIMKMFTLQDYFTSNMVNIPELPVGTLGKGVTNKEHIDKPIVDLFALLDGKPMAYTNMRAFFHPDGALCTQLLAYLKNYLDKQARTLGVEISEIEVILNN